MIRFVLIALLIACFSIFANAQNRSEAPKNLPEGFVSDGCTAYPDGSYRNCCIAHDKDYFRGGSFSDRRNSDKRLYECVKGIGGFKRTINATMMYLGVRVFGTSWLPTKFRWGFGKDFEPSAESAEPEKAQKQKTSLERTKIKAN
ncbi:MAG: hypothetical protein ACK5NT_06015 [Pyrinomonadaceae bacterium]